MNAAEAVGWVREAASSYDFDLVAILRRGSDWPLTALSMAELQTELERRGMLEPLPKEPAALANVLEITLVDHLLVEASKAGLRALRGTERGYPDLELEGPPPIAIDVKVARRSKSGRQTQSRITLFTGNTYFRYPQLQWPGTFRPFRDYAAHVDLLGIYSLDLDASERVTDLEIIVQESWRIASRKRSSTTREYIGAVQGLDDLRSGSGEFDSQGDFERFWRRYSFRVGAAVQKQLDKLLAEQDD